jgi:histidinol phosphatase-like PHP family hydrolase
VIDLHTHTLFSDGKLLPFELVRRAAAAGYRALAITDHVDSSNIDFVVPRIVRAVDEIRAYSALDVIAGAEITHVPPELIPFLVERARELGAAVVVVHGETISEPVEPGTNRAGIEAGADILSHPGLISEEDVVLAGERRVVLEITARKGHSITNGHVARLAVMHGARLTINSDAHAPSDLLTRDMARKVLLGAGLTLEQADEAYAVAESIVEDSLRRSNA